MTDNGINEELRADELTADEAIELVLKRPGMYGLVPKDEHRRMKAERDAALAARDGWASRMMEYAAALAAVERVRAAVNGPHPANSGLDSFTLAHISAALDGAPEPEWEFCFAEIHDDGEIYANGSDEGFQFATAEAARAARIEDSDVVMKRVKGVPAGPWLPVEVRLNVYGAPDV